jgi:hypothetical protein
MTDILGWKAEGVQFQDGSYLSDWEEIYTDDKWHWQYDTHELSFSIYKHEGQFWKLYKARFVKPNGEEYSYGYGGQACRMVEVQYKKTVRSPHSKMLAKAGSSEWIRTYEFNPQFMTPLTVGKNSDKYSAVKGLLLADMA